jgi:hypothetical protein
MKLNTMILSAAVLLSALVAVPSTASAQTVNQRLKHQNKRIDQGIKNHKLTARQAQKLHSRDKSIHARESRDRMANHGKLTKGESHRLQHSLNRTSKTIYKKKHQGTKKN